jgi:hypothetical protein
MDKVNFQIIRESFARVAYSHKTHEKAAEIEDLWAKAVKWVNIILTSLTSGTLISTVFTNEDTYLYISAILSIITLGFILFQLSFDPAEKAEKHRHVAKELWYIREKYINLMGDIVSGNLSDQLTNSRRDQLLEELRLVYKFAPQTNSRAYRKARKSLKLNEELTFTNKEIDQLLPNELKIEKDLSGNSDK